MLLTAQIWDAQKQELAGRVGATSHRIASKVGEVLHAGKTATRRQGYRFKLGTKTSGGRWPMSAMGQKRTCALQNGMSALPPIATAKADSRKRSCPLYPRKRTCAVQLVMSAMGQ